MSISCDPNDLLAAAGPYQKITGSNVESVIIYLLAKKAGLDGLTADQLIDLAKCYDCKIPPGMFKSVEIALLCSATGGVPPCPSSGGSGGTCPQDMQVAWTPTNFSLGSNVGYFIFTDAPGLLTFSSTVSLSEGGFEIDNNSTLQSVSFPNLTQIDPTGAYFGVLFFDTDPSLASVSAPLLTIVGGGSVHVTNSPALTTVNLDSLATVGNQLSITGNTFLTSLSLPALVTATNLFDVSGCTSLSSLSIPVFVPTNTKNVNAANCALNATSVNLVLHRCVLNAGYVNGTVNLSGGTNAAPSGAGVADKATLIGRGVTVLTN